MPAFYVDMIIPLAVKDTYTYEVPASLERQVQFGIRLEVPFGKKKLYAGLVIKVHQNKPSYKTRRVLSVIDDRPIITSRQLDLWQWMSSYYLCDLGEVMFAAMPSKLKLVSETTITPGSQLDDVIFDLSDQEYMIAEAVSIQKALTIEQIRSILEIKTVYPLIKRLFEKGVIQLGEELKESFKPKEVTVISIPESVLANKSDVFDRVKNSQHQTRILLALMQQQNKAKAMIQSELLQMADANHQALLALEKKGLVERSIQTISRLSDEKGNPDDLMPLTDIQQNICRMIQATATDRKPVLLHGVTGSGKTRIYIELIREALKKGRQILYLLPEIALTTQIVQRLQKVLGSKLLVYHSRINDQQRVEVWQKTIEDPIVILAARSGVMLPFSDLGLIIVDEEHDQSYKQEEPNPRYQARDMAIILSRIHQCQIILGSATPAVETFANARKGRYHLLQITERYGKIKLPEMVVIDMKKRSAVGHLSTELLDEMKATREEGFQTILFQNRRGFAPRLMCDNCGWSLDCTNCDTSLTYHQYSNQMQCHLCGYRVPPAHTCPDCGNHELTLRGFGTEMIEEEVKLLLPDFRVARLDLETARGKKNLEKILYDFEAGRVDVLIGTQMVSKGLDFDRVGLVGIISADHIMHYPDFRASERAFQLMTQVAGRSGRKLRRGRVLIQALHTSHPVIKEVLSGRYETFYNREIEERQQFGFPPYSRLIIITTKHTDAEKSHSAAEAFAKYLRQRLSHRVQGPLIPAVGRVRNRYLATVIIKLEKRAELVRNTKNWIQQATLFVRKQKGYSTLRISVNIDP